MKKIKATKLIYEKRNHYPTEEAVNAIETVIKKMNSGWIINKRFIQ